MNDIENVIGPLNGVTLIKVDEKGILHPNDTEDLMLVEVTPTAHGVCLSGETVLHQFVPWWRVVAIFSV